MLEMKKVICVVSLIYYYCVMNNRFYDDEK